MHIRHSLRTNRFGDDLCGILDSVLCDVKDGLLA